MKQIAEQETLSMKQGVKGIVIFLFDSPKLL